MNIAAELERIAHLKQIATSPDRSPASNGNAQRKPEVPTFERPHVADEYGADTLEFLGTGEGVDDDADSWLIRGLLPAELPSILVGPPKSRKSFLMYYWSICVAAGIPALGRATQRGRVLVISREDGIRETRRRLWQIARALNVDLHKLAEDGWLRVDASRPLHLDQPEDLETLSETLNRYRPALVMIDSLSRVHCADENDRSKMAVVTNAWNDLCSRYACAVCLLHHVVKWGEGTLIQKIRGTGDLGALVRVAIGVTKVDGDRSKIEVDGNLADMADEFSVRFTDGTGLAGKTIKIASDLGAVAGQGEGEDPIGSPLVGELMDKFTRFGGGTLTVTALRKSLGARQEVDAALKLIESRGLIVKARRGRKFCGYNLTEAGQAFAHGDSGCTTAMSPSPTPSLGDDGRIAALKPLADRVGLS